MDSFIIGNGVDYIRVYEINFYDKSYFKSLLEIKCDGYTYNGSHHPAVVDIESLLEELIKCNNTLSGRAAYLPLERDIELVVDYVSLGHVNIFAKHSTLNGNGLHFDIETDQTYINQTILQLKEVLANVPNQ